MSSKWPSQSALTFKSQQTCTSTCWYSIQRWNNLSSVRITLKKFGSKLAFSGDLEMAIISQACTSVKKCLDTSAVRVFEHLVLSKLCAKNIDLLNAKIKDVKCLLKSIPTKTRGILKPRLNSTTRPKGILNGWKPLHLHKIPVQRKIPL